ncbi:hypothetical protein [Rhodobacter capsulatus]|jgi:hypothetical protein|uniref:Flp pilus assembly protein, pilin Flp n=1 Tax=Rhodobacter capsulatus (strain ATCC BAA-309 / NBRC 16581 / SB1003) TaxID=272942 RepID=D5AMX5_RHOCB|nr:hypothetical protein [Rhodobacter capsulatus]ADE84264.1 conserved hypothetical protein [Rhodobacter capsulatus SB 1003]ETD02998.1 hypothetical protein U714_03355 [Rhodobacter capsulatus DE442]ETD79627.1 hypothetical protein U717_03365 [Rhodobacter capsulatus R121]ETD83298.1 hypothetical protein U716_08635 [Rhodobacter capsulatus B6]ETD83584.1 hypothetical protein U703_08985 [Rhodobacter capsulatus YW1]
MKFFKFARKIRTEEDGAVTVDWVVLTAAVVGLGAAALLLVREKTEGLTKEIGTYLDSAEVKSTF